MSSGNFRNFHSNFLSFCKLWIFVDIQRSRDPLLGSSYACRISNFGFSFFVFEECDSHVKNLSLKLKLVDGRPTLGWPCTLSLRATIMNLMGVRLMADWHFADFDRQRYFLFLSSHFWFFQSLVVVLQTGVSVPCLWIVWACLSYSYYTLYIGVVKWVL